MEVIRYSIGRSEIGTLHAAKNEKTLAECCSNVTNAEFQRGEEIKLQCVGFRLLGRGTHMPIPSLTVL